MIYGAALMVLLLAVAITWSAILTRAERAEEVREEAGSVATAAASVFNEYFTSLDATASMLQLHPSVRALDGDVCRPLFARILHEQPLLNDVLLRAADGHLVASGVEGARFRIHTPLIELSKAEIIRRGVQLGLDYGLTHSCYDPRPDGRPCGRCDSCVLRAKGFSEAGAIDPVMR